MWSSFDYKNHTTVFYLSKDLGTYVLSERRIYSMRYWRQNEYISRARYASPDTMSVECDNYISCFVTLAIRRNTHWRFYWRSVAIVTTMCWRRVGARSCSCPSSGTTADVTLAPMTPVCPHTVHCCKQFYVYKTKGPKGPWVAHLRKRSKVTVEPFTEDH